MTDANNSMVESEPNEILENRFELLKQIGTGGISTVYKAKDRVLKRVIAVKVLNPDKIKEEHLVRLHREAKAICKLNHKNIIDVFDFVITTENVPILGMEYVDGKSLKELVDQSGPLDIMDSLSVFQQIANALSYSHNKKILHRDLKPANILVHTSEKEKFEVKIVDFGIAKISDINDDSITHSKIIVGTPTYISPEQARNQTVDDRSDIYSFGCLMYFTLTGKPPFKGETMIETINMQIYKQPPSLKEGNKNANYPPPVENLVSIALNKNPQKRYQSMKELENFIQDVKSSLATETEFPLDPTKEVKIKSKKESSLLLNVALYAIPIFFILIILVTPLTYLNFESDKNTEKTLNKLREARAVLINNQVREILKFDKTWYVLEGDVTNKQLSNLRDLYKNSKLDISRLKLSNSKVSDEQLRYLLDLPLVILDLRNTKISDKGLSIIGKSKTLRSLLLDNCSLLTPEGISTLKDLSTLEVLSLKDTSVNDLCVKNLSKLNLQLLFISGSSRITDKAVDYLVQFKDLKAVRIGNTKITKSGIAKIQKLSNLYFLGLANLNLTSDKMPPKFNSQITVLDLSNNPLDGHCIDKIIELDNLWLLDIRNCDNLNYSDSEIINVLKNDKKTHAKAISLLKEKKRLGLNRKEFLIFMEKDKEVKQIVAKNKELSTKLNANNLLWSKMRLTQGKIVLSGNYKFWSAYTTAGDKEYYFEPEVYKDPGFFASHVKKTALNWESVMGGGGIINKEHAKEKENSN